ncbi:hypothetical protein UNPF46_30720 [Bradyrhizobium sp. UNPF46]|nr:hypothetical protein UNPF46_30720 [Bradyrhizobium sp. UNPF46]
MPAFRPLRIAVVDDDDSTPGSTVCAGTGQPAIAVHQLFIDLVREAQVGSDDYWKWMFFISHELAHVTLGHATRELELSCETPSGRILRADAERAADYWAGFLLGTLGAQGSDATAALRAIVATPYLNNLKASGGCYPPMEERLQTVINGWEQAGKRPQPPKTILDGFILADNRDFDGYNFYSEDANTLDACADACVRRADGRVQCKGFSYDKLHRKCFLKGHLVTVAGKVAQTPFSSADVLLFFDPYSIVGIAREKGKAALPAMIPLAPKQVEECDRFCTEDRKSGNALFGDKKSAAASTVNACRNSCRSDLTCLAAQWKPETHECSLYSKVTGWHHDADDSAVILTRKYQPDPLCKGGSNYSCKYTWEAK